MPVHQGHQRTKYLYTLLFQSLLNCIALLFESHATFQVFFTTQQNTRIWRLKIGLVIETWHLITETHGSIWYANCNHVLSWNLWKVCKMKQVGFLNRAIWHRNIDWCNSILATWFSNNNKELEEIWYGNHAWNYFCAAFGCGCVRFATLLPHRVNKSTTRS